MDTSRIPATLAILTRNNETTLRRALESAKEFDDIIVCDGYSSDGTLAIAKEYGARILMQDKSLLDPGGRLVDYGGARNQTLNAAKHNWFFFLDSDEYCGEDLLRAIRAVIAERGEEGIGAFWVNRLYVVEGKIIHHASTYPNRQMRFFSRNAAEHFIKRVHERIRLKPGVASELLGGVMYVPFDTTREKLRAKWDHQIAVEVARRGSMTFRQFVSDVFESAKVSLLWGFRFARYKLFGRGTHMPLWMEYERQRFHPRLLAELWKAGSFHHYVPVVLALLAACIAVFFGTFRLSEAPGIWYDEGYFMQMAMNVAEHRGQVLQTAPNTYVSSANETGGFPLIMPVALAYQLFGVGVGEGRIAMVVYLFGFLAVAYTLQRLLFGAKYAALTSLLLATCATLYGNGKSVLGEVPGLFYLLLTLIAITYLERSRYTSLRAYAATGLFAGLCVVTKPIYALLAVPFGILMLSRVSQKALSWRGVLVGTIGGVLPIGAWLAIQFGPNDSLADMLAFYANPYEVPNLLANAIHNLTLFATETTPFYTLALFALWSVSLVVGRERERYADAEMIAWGFSLCILLAFLRLPPWYRYLFPALIVSLAFFPVALNRLVAGSILRSFLVYAICIALAVGQCYQLVHSSYVASFYDSTRTRDLVAALSRLDPHEAIFVYNVPEVAALLPTRQYYQYIKPYADNDGAIVGADQLSHLADGSVQYVIVGSAWYRSHLADFPGFRLLEQANRYAILTRL